MALVPNTKSWTISDGQTEYANFDTIAKVLQIKNGATITLYADDGVTAGLTFNATGSAPVVSASAAATGAAGTITTASVGVARISPTTARTGVIMQAGTVNGQSCWVLNEATTAAKSVQMDVSGTSNVASGTSCFIFGGQGKHFIWDASTSLWECNDNLTLGTLIDAANGATALANSGTIATAGIGTSRVTTSGNVTGAVLAAGVIIGQEVTVVNESANTITFAASSSNVADANTSAIPANSARKFKWTGTNWFRCA